MTADKRFRHASSNDDGSDQQQDGQPPRKQQPQHQDCLEGPHPYGSDEEAQDGNRHLEDESADTDEKQQSSCMTYGSETSDEEIPLKRGSVGSTNSSDTARHESSSLPLRTSHSREVSFGDSDDVHIYPLESDNSGNESGQQHEDCNEFADGDELELGGSRRRRRAPLSPNVDRGEENGRTMMGSGTGGLLRPARFSLADARTKSNPNDKNHPSLTSSASRRVLVEAPQRISKTIDLETGREGARAQCAVIREEDERHPQMRRRRLQKRASKAMKKSYFWGRKKNVDETEDEDARKKRLNPKGQNSGLMPFKSTTHIPINDDTQYRLFSVDVSMKRTWHAIHTEFS